MSGGSRMLSFSPEARTGLYYSFAFSSMGVTSAYFAIWLFEKGISASDTGIISSVPIFIMLAVNMVVGRIADRARDWRSVVVVGSMLSGVMSIGLFFVDEFWGILIFWTLTAIPIAAALPVLDAAAVRMTRRNGTEYGKIRAWGTLGFMGSLAATGYIVAWFGSWIFVPLMVLTSVLRGVFSLQLPRFRAPEGERIVPAAFVASHVRELFRLWFILPVLGISLVFSTLFILNIFVALVWKGSGISEPAIGALLATGALSEAILMFMFKGFASRFSARHLLLAAAIVTAIRWALMALNPPVWALFLLQLLHGISFGFGFLGVVNFIANWTSEDMAAEAQSLSVVLQQGASVVTLVGFGFLFQIMGIDAFFIAAGLCALGALFVWLSLLLKSSNSEIENGPA